MTHGLHTLEGPVLHDGCAECAARGNDPSVAIAHMDSATFAKAWRRAILWQRDGALDDLQEAEVRTLSVLWSVRCAQQSSARGMYPDSPITFDDRAPWLDDKLNSFIDTEHALADEEDRKRADHVAQANTGFGRPRPA